MISVSNFANYTLKFPNSSQGSFGDASNMTMVKIQKKTSPIWGLRFPKKLDFSFEYNTEPQSGGYEFLVLR